MLMTRAQLRLRDVLVSERPGVAWRRSRSRGTSRAGSRHQPLRRKRNCARARAQAAFESSNFSKQCAPRPGRRRRSVRHVGPPRSTSRCVTCHGRAVVTCVTSVKARSRCRACSSAGELAGSTMGNASEFESGLAGDGRGSARSHSVIVGWVRRRSRVSTRRHREIVLRFGGLVRRGSSMRGFKRSCCAQRRRLASA